MLTLILLIAGIILACYIAYALIVGGVAIIAMFGDIIICGLFIALFILLIRKLFK